MFSPFAVGIAAAIEVVGAMHSTAFDLGLALFVTAYPAIAVKLWKQSRRRCINPTENQSWAMAGAANQVISETQQRTKHNTKILKLYVAVIVIF